MSGFLSALVVQELDEFAGTWQLQSPLVYQSDLLRRVLTVPAGFVSDFASVPRAPFLYLAAGGKGDRAAVVHDWAYSSQFVDRATADKILREALLATGYSAILANMFYVAVRTFGESHWTKPNVPQPANVQAAMQLEAMPA